MEFLAEVWESMNSTFSLFQRGGVWSTVSGVDLHSWIQFSTWEENVHHQRACLWDIKERSSWLCVQRGFMGGGSLDQLMHNLITKMHSSSQLNLLSILQNWVTWHKSPKNMVGFKTRLFWFASILKPNYFNMFGSDNASLQLNLLCNSMQLIQLKPKNCCLSFLLF